MTWQEQYADLRRTREMQDVLAILRERGLSFDDAADLAWAMETGKPCPEHIRAMERDPELLSSRSAAAKWNRDAESHDGL